MNKRAGLNKQAGWKIGKNLLKEQDGINEHGGILNQIPDHLFGKLQKFHEKIQKLFGKFQKITKNSENFGKNQEIYE